MHRYLNLSGPKMMTFKLIYGLQMFFRGGTLNSNKVLYRSPVYKTVQAELSRGRGGRGAQNPLAPQALTPTPLSQRDFIKYSLRTTGHSDF